MYLNLATCVTCFLRLSTHIRRDVPIISVFVSESITWNTYSSSMGTSDDPLHCDKRTCPRARYSSYTVSTPSL